MGIFSGLSGAMPGYGRELPDWLREWLFRDGVWYFGDL